jgi:hypothetical protein
VPIEQADRPPALLAARALARRTAVNTRVADLPTRMDNPGVTLRTTPWGGVACTYAELGAGTDLAPVLQGLPHDACPFPHWGYMLKGAVRVRYTDDREDVIRAGEVFYLPPGHTAVFEEDSAMVEFSPQREYDEVLAHIDGKAQG